jgi:V8-like Glu-specific endopeptidase
VASKVSTGRRWLVPVLLIALLCLSGGLDDDTSTRLLAAGSGVRTVSAAERKDTANYWTAQRMAQASARPAPSNPDPGSDTWPPTVATPPATTDPPAGQRFAGIPAVGALFSTDGGRNGHYCTASVVHSPTRDLVITAAHCIHDGEDGDYQNNLAFVPGYHDGQTPYGVWVSTQMVVDPRWVASSDPDRDVGFLVVHKAGSDAHVEDVTGANRLGGPASLRGQVRVTGYPDELDAPITCQTAVRWEDDRPRFDCAAFSDGTSGAPWVVDADPRTQLGTLVGLIGGYQLGGESDDVSYSPVFGDEIQSLYTTALRAALQ